ncbi:related to RNA-binding proteins [Cephalotrichum gorgonifer]|uniref:Related to RNA-binding proteins n=1 Tax=Cephalotrichum gorgonifer TaxID=2041049 RepID=A0AAE8MTJ2_9PEZI|nr:related to RNA-binding proteins [Cephalotrichum gorgonifer]
MNQIRAIQALNKKELENGISPEASWHTDYRDTAYVYFGGLPYELSEGDVIVIFSQFGEPVFIKLARDRETGKSKGFGWLKYQDQRSTDLAVDNLGGAEVLGRVMRVDHARFKPHEDDDPEEGKVDWESMMRMEGKKLEEDTDEDEESGDERGGRSRRKGAEMLDEERELAKLVRDHDEDDPMKAYLIEEKKKEIAEARDRAERKGNKERKERHRHHRSQRSRRHGSEGEDDDDSRRDRRERRHRRESPDGRESKRERGSRRKSPEGEEPAGGDSDRDDEERDRRRRDKERRRDRDEEDDRDSGKDRRRRHREREESRDRRRDRDGDRHRKERRRSRSP